MNLIPQQAGKTPSYWCTWSSQNYGRGEINPDYHIFLGQDGGKLARAAMTEENVQKWMDQFPEIRKDLFFLLDDGWDVPFGVHPDQHNDAFGTLEANEERFPSFPGTPAERLKGLNDFVKKGGWKGLGLWIPAQPAGQIEDGDALTAYWTERILWCRDAEVCYWKVDWGTRDHNAAYRRWLSSLAKELYPQLIVEHAYCMGPVNGLGIPEKGNPSDRFAQMADECRGSLEIHQFSEVFRTYDVYYQLSSVSSLDRAATLLQGEGGLLNCEDDAWIAASLGCTLGVMRSIYWGDIPGMDYDSLLFRKRNLEVVGAVRWQRIAPAFTGTETLVSQETLTDVWFYHPGECWDSHVIGKEIHQTAPAVIARNMPLPEVRIEGDVKPFIACSCNPSGAVTIASFGRIMPEHQWVHPKAHVSAQLQDWRAPVGLFGHFGSFTAKLDSPVPLGAKFYAQSLISSEAVEITDQVELGENQFTVSGELLQKIYQNSPCEQDLSQPSVMIKAVI